MRTVKRTLFIEHHGRGGDFAAPTDLAYVPAFRITRAAQELTEAPALQSHRLAAQLAHLRLFRFRAAFSCARILCLRAIAVACARGCRRLRDLARRATLRIV